jgi:UDP-N-acetylglucosamine 2-epimerase (non-hydrolysing)
VKIATVLGTRPEIIRLSLIIAKLDARGNHVLIHTGQNFDRALSDVFFDEMGIRAPDHFLAVRGDTPAGQIAQILERCERVFLDERPDRLLILGDTNSALCAIVAKRMGIPVFHMEAGNRCYDDRVPEEVNRRLIDHSSDVLMPYTERSRANLLREGIAGERVHVIGNPIFQVLDQHAGRIDAAAVVDTMGLERGGYFLVTLHRAENVDAAPRLNAFMAALSRLSERYQQPVVVSTHPRTAHRMQQFGVGGLRGDVRFPNPFGLFDFVRLEKSARCVLSDSGTVQEECAIFGVPNVTLRDVTERPETLERGSNILTGADPDQILDCVATVLALPPAWDPPPEYMVRNVSDTVIRLVTGFHLNLGRRSMA